MSAGLIHQRIHFIHFTCRSRRREARSTRPTKKRAGTALLVSAPTTHESGLGSFQRSERIVRLIRLGVAEGSRGQKDNAIETRTGAERLVVQEIQASSYGRYDCL